ncbi:hypothetical protein RV134_270341 [Roseovarius sp. EC-HK134]|nr:hypothetical protein RV134_270341 [Roseovarius sp. EC-HK134]VVT16656.1 hypothetical protein RV420_330067 [Roseovarius sp. EC-SD190]
MPAFRKHNGVTAIVKETKGTRDDIAHTLQTTDYDLPLHGARLWLCQSGTGNTRPRGVSWNADAGRKQACGANRYRHPHDRDRPRRNP